MICDCGGLLFVVSIEEFPKHLTKQERLVYDRVCDVECQKCHKVYYSQPYDGFELLSLAKDAKQIKNHK